MTINELKNTLKEINDLSKLEENWDSYEAYPIDADQIKMACNFVEKYYRLMPKATIIPLNTGNVALMWFVNGNEMEINFVNQTVIYCHKTHPDEDIEENYFDVNNFPGICELFKWL